MMKLAVFDSEMRRANQYIVKNGDTLSALLQANNYLNAQGNFGQAATKTGNELVASAALERLTEVASVGDSDVAMG